MVARVDAIESVRILRSDGPPPAAKAADLRPQCRTNTGQRTDKAQETTPMKVTTVDRVQDHGPGLETSRPADCDHPRWTHRGSRQRQR